MDLITYLEENSKIHRQFIDDFFEYYEYNNFYIDIENIIQWCKIEDKELFRKEVIEKYKKDVNYIEQDNKIYVNGLTCKMLINDDKVRNDFYELEHLVNKYNRYKIKKLKKKIRLLKKSLKDNNKVFINTIKNIDDGKITNDIEYKKDNDDEYIINFSNYIKWFLIGFIFIRLILLIIAYNSSCSNSEWKCYSRFNTVGNIIKFCILFILIIKFFSLFCSSYLISFIKNKLI
jgi:hypothetical protein